MASLNVKNGGNWVPPKETYVKQSGAWTRVKKVWNNVSGAWTNTWTAPNIELSTTSVSPTGVIESVNSGTYPVTVYNRASAGPLLVNSVTLSNNTNIDLFTASPTSATIASGGSQIFNLSFQSNSTGSSSATINFNNNAAIITSNTASVSYTTTASKIATLTAPVSGSYAYGNIYTSSTGPTGVVVAITNSGHGTLTVAGVVAHSGDAYSHSFNFTQGGSYTAFGSNSTTISAGTTKAFTAYPVAGASAGSASSYFTILSDDNTGHSSVTVNTTATLVVDTTPTYAIAPGVSSINEGSSVTFTVTTTNVANGTTLYWTTTGTVNSSDFTSGTTSGTVTINSNTGTITRAISADSTTEGSESFQLQLRTGSTSGTVQATSSSVTINDTSTTPAPPPYSPPYDFQSGSYSYSAVYNDSTSVTVRLTNPGNYPITWNPGVAGTIVSSSNTQAVIKTKWSYLDSINWGTSGSYSWTVTATSGSDYATTTLTVSYTAPVPLQIAWDSSTWTLNLSAAGSYSTTRTLSATSGSGSATVQETSRPSAFSVSVGGVSSPGATKDYTLSSGGSVTVPLGIVVPAGTFQGTFTGSFTALPSSGQASKNVDWSATLTYNETFNAPSSLLAQTSYDIYVLGGQGGTFFSYSGYSSGAGYLDTNGTGLFSGVMWPYAGTFTYNFSFPSTGHTRTYTAVVGANEIFVNSTTPQANVAYDVAIRGGIPGDSFTYSGSASGSGSIDANGEAVFAGLSFPSGTYTFNFHFNSSGHNRTYSVTL